MNELSTVIKPQLPTTIEDLQKFVLIGREKLIAVKANIRAIEKLELATEVREQKQEEAQFLASALLDAETRIGEILKERPTETRSSHGGTSKPLPEGINKKQSHYFQTLAENKDIVEKVKQEAINNDDLPTRTEVLRQVKEREREQERQNIVIKPKDIPMDKFDVIYADPPWRYDFAETDNRAIENKYPSMDAEDIKNIKVPSADSAVLFLWATAPKLIEALEVMKAWGFTYKTNAIWDKEIIGMGYWFRGQHELLLVGTKGNYSPPQQENRESSVYKERRTEHSKKPIHYYELIEKSFPSGKYLEMFSRHKHNENWEVWGNQCA